MNTFVFQPGMTWRKIGFALYSNSLAYRDVLENNPVWSVTETPPPGTALRGSSSARMAGGATQQPSIYSIPSTTNYEDYYPFADSTEYFAALAKYSPSSLRKIDRINGLTSDNVAALSGIQ